MVENLPQRYTYQDTIHESTFGSVYLGWDETAHRQVVIKRFEPEHHAAYLKEISAGFGLEHPHLAFCVDTFYLQDNTGCLVFEYYPQGTLLKQLESAGRLGVPEVVTCLKSVLSALMYLHELGRIHCDIKPSNIFLKLTATKKYHYALGDFGVACFAREVQNQRYTAGSPAYTAPERLLGGFEPNSDLYSLGILGYELMVGARPFDGSVDEIRHAHNAKRADLEKIACDPMRDFIGSLLAKSQLERMPTARLAYRVLSQVEEAIKHHSISRGVRPWHMPKTAKPMSVVRHTTDSGHCGWGRVGSFLLAAEPRGVMVLELDGLVVVGAQYDNHLEFYDLQGVLLPDLTVIGTHHQFVSGSNHVAYYSAQTIQYFDMESTARKTIVQPCRDLRAFAVNQGTVAWCDGTAWHLQSPGTLHQVDLRMHQYALAPIAHVLNNNAFLLTDGVMNQELLLWHAEQESQRVWTFDGPIFAVAVGRSSALVLTMGTNQTHGQFLWRVAFDAEPKKVALPFSIKSACVSGEFFWVQAADSGEIFCVEQDETVTTSGIKTSSATHLGVDAGEQFLAAVVAVEKQHCEVRVWQR